MSNQAVGPQTPSEDDLVARLSRVRSVRHVDDERPNREQIEAKRHVVYPGPPVPLPRWLWGGKKKRSG
jgi:hypothetical protein